MGVINSKQSRDTPQKLVAMKHLDTSVNSECLDQSMVDGKGDLEPRSPHICRTPIQEVIKAKQIVSKPQNLTELSDKQTTSSVLAQKLISKLAFDPLDPRSPSMFINRTPIVFDEMSEAPVSVDVVPEESGDRPDASMIGVFEKSFANDEDLEAADPRKTDDPRSPSDGVERTPIVFAEEISDKEIIESVIEKFDSGEIQNKQLERVKNPRGRLHHHRSSENKGIYEDKSPRLIVSSTPKRILQSSTPKRTPLSCVANKSHLRSKSAENSGKSTTGRIQVSSYDDNNLKGRHQHLCSSGESPQATTGRRLNI